MEIMSADGRWGDGEMEMIRDTFQRKSKLPKLVISMILITSRFSSVPSLEVASSSQPTVTSMLRRFFPCYVDQLVMPLFGHLECVEKDHNDHNNDKDAGRPVNCQDLAFQVSSPTERLQHGELLQQVGKSLKHSAKSSACQTSAQLISSNCFISAGLILT